MEIETEESRDAAPVAMESEDSNTQGSMVPPPPPPSDNTADSKKRLSKGSGYHINRRDATPRSPATRPTNTSSPFGHARTQSLGTSTLLNAPFLVPICSPPNSPRGSHHSTIRAHPSLTYYTLDGHNLGGTLGPPFLNPVRPHPPRISQIQKAMEAAIVAERRRSKDMEAREETMSAIQLREVLKQERHRMSQLAADLAKHKTMTVQCQLEAEVLEEGRINGLMRRLEELQLEKGRIINELEREEEMVCILWVQSLFLKH